MVNAEFDGRSARRSNGRSKAQRRVRAGKQAGTAHVLKQVAGRVDFGFDGRLSPCQLGECLDCGNRFVRICFVVSAKEVIPKLRLRQDVSKSPRGRQRRKGFRPVVVVEPCEFAPALRRSSARFRCRARLWRASRPAASARTAREARSGSRRRYGDDLGRSK
jgi:hypothetical protein